MAGSALLWRAGHYSFGNADANSAANQNNLGSNILQNDQQRIAGIQGNGAPNPDVADNEENALLAPKKRPV